MGRKVQPVCGLSVRMVPELVIDAVRPLELVESEEQRHKRILQDRALDAVLPVAPVGGEDPIFYDANTGPLGLIRRISGDETYGRTEGD
jgi:hypothetical protein